MPYDKGCHTVFHHRYHLVWITKYRYKVLKGAVRERVREILRQVCEELGVSIISGALSTDHVHMFVSIPPKHAVSDVMRRLKGRSSRKIQMEFPDLPKRYWGGTSGRGASSVRQAGWSPTRSYFSTSKTPRPLNLPTSVGSGLALE